MMLFTIFFGHDLQLENSEIHGSQDLCGICIVIIRSFGPGIGNSDDGSVMSDALGQLEPKGRWAGSRHHLLVPGLLSPAALARRSCMPKAGSPSCPVQAELKVSPITWPLRFPTGMTSLDTWVLTPPSSIRL